MDYIDGLLITDKQGRIQYSVRHNPNFQGGSHELDLEDILYKSIFEVYPTLNQENSSLYQSMKTGKAIYLPEQRVGNYKGGHVVTTNLTLPLINNGQVIGAVELIKDITTLEDMDTYDQSSMTAMKDKYSHQTSKGYEFKDIITVNPVMKSLISQGELASKSPSSVLVYGETGTGKELFVQSIHNGSSGVEKPFIAQNCAAIPESIFESLLFGSVKGAYTGAEDKMGLFEMAHGGTLFLDEINSMPLNLQAKLLRVLQDGKVRRLGDSKDKKVDVRIIAAMNVPPMEALNQKLLREDFFYRISVFSLNILPLRERKEDIMPLTQCFIKKHNKRLNKQVVSISEEVVKLFSQYDWPGNVRELEHVLEGAINLTQDKEIQLGHLPAYLGKGMVENNEGMMDFSNTSFAEMIDGYEKRIIASALTHTGGNISKAAKLLKLPRQTFRYKMKKFNLF